MVHYTTAEAALNIIRSKRFWMRNTNSISDYREVQHGFDILESFFFNESKRKAFTEALDSCAVGAASEAIQLFVQSWNDTRFNTYISSLSVYLPKRRVSTTLRHIRSEFIEFCFLSLAVC
jgi:hypothetical protein